MPLAAPTSSSGLLDGLGDRAARAPGARPDLLDRLSGVAAQATTALQNGRLVDQITHQALHDELTGLANRLQFKTQLARRGPSRPRSSGEQVTLFYLDLDCFKPVNDEFGHDAGDELLVAVGERLDACTRARTWWPASAATSSRC